MGSPSPEICWGYETMYVCQCQAPCQEISTLRVGLPQEICMWAKRTRSPRVVLAAKFLQKDLFIQGKPRRAPRNGANPLGGSLSIFTYSVCSSSVCFLHVLASPLAAVFSFFHIFAMYLSLTVLVCCCISKVLVGLQRTEWFCVSEQYFQLHRGNPS